MFSTFSENVDFMQDCFGMYCKNMGENKAIVKGTGFDVSS